MARIRNFSYSFTANQVIKIRAVGSQVKCTSGAADFQISPDRKELIDFREGLGITFEEQFSTLEITNGSTAQIITVYIGDGDIDDSRVFGNITTVSRAANTLANPADQTATTTPTSIAANANRSRIIIQADIGNTNNLRAGVAGDVSATRGLQITPGASYAFHVTTAIDVASESGSETFRVSEESEV